jgi:hypothetical protein
MLQFNIFVINPLLVIHQIIGMAYCAAQLAKHYIFSA